jgi:ABC-type ATPase with predicted acetyltransferase domain
MPDATTLDIAWSAATAVTPSPRVLQVASMFGLGLDENRTEAVVPPMAVPVAPGNLVFVTGPSGSGKSSILRCLADAARTRTDLVALAESDLDPPPDDVPIVEQLGPTLADAARILAAAGLADAFTMLRSARQLSEGQRLRWRLARLMARAEEEPASRGRLVVLLLDEFGATLDRDTAAVIARNLRRWTTASRTCAVVATTHDDLLEPLAPDVLIHKPIGAPAEVVTR